MYIPIHLTALNVTLIIVLRLSDKNFNVFWDNLEEEETFWGEVEYEKVQKAMVKNLLPISQKLLDLPVLQLYHKAFNKGWEELEGEDTSTENVSLGYFRIGDQEATTGIDLLELPDEAMATVDDVITSIMSDIRTGKFGKEPTVPAPKYSEEFAWICQDDSITEEAEGED